MSNPEYEPRTNSQHFCRLESNLLRQLMRSSLEHLTLIFPCLQRSDHPATRGQVFTRIERKNAWIVTDILQNDGGLL